MAGRCGRLVDMSLGNDRMGRQRRRRFATGLRVVLLTAAGAATLVTLLWAAVWGSVAMRSPWHRPRVVLGDTLAPQNLRVQGLRGAIQHPPFTGQGPRPGLLLTHSPGQPSRLCHIGPQTIYAGVSRDLPTPATINVTGTPYGLLAFERRSALLVEYTPGRRVYLVEASLALRLAAEQPAQWAELQAAIAPLGEVGVLVFGERQLAQARETFQAQAPALPVLVDCPQRGQALLDWLLGAMWWLGTPGRPLFVITDGFLLADDAGSRDDRRSFAHYLGPETPPAVDPGRLARHDDLQALLSYLRQRAAQE